jgi:plasmid stabilization system protein ParE
MSSPLHASASPRATVDKFALSARAEAELIEIYDHSATQFGPYQAEAYLAPIGSFTPSPPARRSSPI